MGPGRLGSLDPLGSLGPGPAHEETFYDIVISCYRDVVSVLSFFRYRDIVLS